MTFQEQNPSSVIIDGNKRNVGCSIDEIRMNPYGCNPIPEKKTCHKEYFMVVLSQESCTDERQMTCNNRVKENVKFGESYRENNFAIIEVWAKNKDSLAGFEEDLNSQIQQFNALFLPKIGNNWNCVNRFLDFSVILNDKNDALKFDQIFGSFEFPSAEEPLTLSRFYYPAQDKEQSVEPCFDKTCSKQMRNAMVSLGVIGRDDFSKRSSFDYSKGKYCSVQSTSK